MVYRNLTLRTVALGLVLVWLAGCAGPAVQKPKVAPANPALALKFTQEGRQAYEQGRKAAAVDAWKQAVSLNPEDAATVNNLALLLQEEKHFSEAATFLETGLQYSPDVPQLHYNLAIISELYLLDLKKALVHYRTYRKLTGAEDKQVEGWIADLERRLD
ncbi:MAG TPA: tetratricopeptide repeat protein [Marinobacter sp.]|nr:tetratricopeptide repeat protein [Marinobacter sp.]